MLDAIYVGRERISGITLHDMVLVSSRVKNVTNANRQQIFIQSGSDFIFLFRAQIWIIRITFSCEIQKYLSKFSLTWYYTFVVFYKRFSHIEQQLVTSVVHWHLIIAGWWQSIVYLYRKKCVRNIWTDLIRDKYLSHWTSLSHQQVQNNQGSGIKI